MLELISHFFQPNHSISCRDLHVDRPYFGKWARYADPNVFEELIVWLRSEQEIEVHCHGGEWAWRSIVSDLEQAANVQLLAWEDHLGKQFAGDTSQTRIEALRLLPNALTTNCAMVLWDQHQGAFDHAIEIIVQAIQHEDVIQAWRLIDHLLQFARLGQRLTSEWQVIMMGPANVGKSSLINAILGFERSIVFDHPGTTRDTVRGSTAIQGWPMSVSDSAGLRAAESSVELAGIDRSRKLAQSADLVIWTFDQTQQIDLIEREINALFGNPGETSAENSAPSILVVQNKIDLAEHERVKNIGRHSVIHTSAVRGDGIDVLMRAIVQELIPITPEAGAAVPFLASQSRDLRQIQKLMRKFYGENPERLPLDASTKLKLTIALKGLLG